MSYCRFSSDGWTSDVYVYHSADGWVIHVASMRYTNPVPFPELPDHFWELPGEDVFPIMSAQNSWIKQARPVSIGLPEDGRTFVDGTPEECADRLDQLQSLGYRIPAGVIESLREEVDS